MLDSSDFEKALLSLPDTRNRPGFIDYPVLPRELDLELFHDNVTMAKNLSVNITVDDYCSNYKGILTRPLLNIYTLIQGKNAASELEQRLLDAETSYTGFIPLL